MPDAAEEPLLTAEDKRVWGAWIRAAAAHGKTLAHRRALDRAARVVDAALVACPSACAMWSGGKDSTVMTHLLRARAVSSVPVASEKDDLDYPGEREYVEQWARAWGLQLTVLTPPVSPRAWLAEHASQLAADEDFHSRAAGLSKAAFYDVVEDFGARFGLVFLGLRSEESKGRAMNRATRGLIYRKAPSPRHPEGQWVATPLGDWRGIDVYAYAERHGVELLSVYRCVAFAHADAPWRVRKSWWIPGADARWGGIAWLRHYWPGLYAQLCRWMPDAARHA